MEERPVCSIRKYGKIPITQKLFYCKTCKFNPVETMCESCAKFCHSGHEIVEIGYKLGYCHCGYGIEKCHCFLENPVPGDDKIPEGRPRQCDFRISGNSFHPMDKYRCQQCGLEGNRLCCYACFMMCHKGHNGIADDGRSSSAYCDCGDPNQRYNCLLDPPSTFDPPLPHCTYSTTGDKFTVQKLYVCRTCNFDSNQCICEGCAKFCHEGHDVVFASECEGFCDCGSGLLPTKCKIMESIEPAQ